jgi:hypothetical protein
MEPQQQKMRDTRLYNAHRSDVESKGTNRETIECVRQKKKEKRDETMEIETAGFTLCGLPLEVLMCVASEASAHDVEALGATCSLLRCVARDDCLWRLLFRRDYGVAYDQSKYLYDPRNLAALAHPWPERVLRWIALERAVDSPSLPPTVSDEAWLPAPFAFMRAAGKDARWLYIAHARRIERHPTCDINWVCRAQMFESDGPRVGTLCLSGEGTASWMVSEDGTISWAPSIRRIFIGDAWAMHGDCVDVLGGCAYGYGVILDVDKATGQVAAWEERSRADRGWCVRVGQDCVTLTHDLGSEACIKHTISNEGNDRTWHRMIGNRARGWWFFEDTTGHTYEETIVDEDAKTRTRVTTAQGAVSEYTQDASLRRTGLGTTEYANGDRVEHMWDGGDLVAIKAFTCSPRCADSAFARRVIVAPRWNWARVQVTTLNNDYAYWPLDDPDTERAFWRYVEAGHIGWVPAVRSAALYHRARGGLAHA